MAKFKKGQHIRNKYNGTVYLITDVLEASYVIECKLINWLLPFEQEDEWELIEDNQEIIELLNTAKYLLRGHKQNLNVQWAIDKINQAIKLININPMNERIKFTDCKKLK